MFMDGSTPFKMEGYLYESMFDYMFTYTYIPTWKYFKYGLFSTKA